MLSRSIAPLAMALTVLGLGSVAGAETDRRVTGPHTHSNLAVYFIHGASAPGPVPLTLPEALANGSTRVIETGRVNELKIENAGEKEVFIQAGDIVKGGRQDRVLTVSLVLPPRSGPVPVAAFCVEAGRWSARAGDSARHFTSASEAMPSRRALLAMAAAPPAVEETAPRMGGVQQRVGGAEQRLGTASRQQQVWDSVASTQERLAAGLKARVKAAQSETSLQLSLENARLKEARAPYLAAIEAQGLKDDDVIGYVAAINGRPVSANLYPSNGLFRKVWPRQLAAVATEAIGDRPEAGAPPAPQVSAVRAFLTAAERGTAQERKTAAGMRQETRDGPDVLYNEARRPDGAWVHRNYLAR